MEKETTKQTDQTDQIESQQESQTIKIMDLFCTCDAWTEQDARCEHLDNCIFKTNK